MQTVDIFASPLPFSTMNVKHVMRQGATIKEMVEHFTGGQVHLDAAVFINGHMVFRDNWHVVRPKAGTLININILPQGGGGGKNPLASLLSIALLIAAPYASTALLGSTLAATSIGIGTLTYGGILSGVIGIVGKLAISALAPPPKQGNAGSGVGVNNSNQSPTQFIEGARNQLNPFDVVPVCLGTNRMVPLLAGRSYQETANNKQYVRQLFNYGYGDQLLISELKIGETPISQFDGIDIEQRLTGNLHTGTTLYTNDVFQDGYSVLLQQVDGYTTRATQLQTNEAIVDVTFPRGLASFDTQGNRNAYTVELELQYKLTSGSVWSAGASSYTAVGAQSIVVADPYRAWTVQRRIYFVSFSVFIDEFTGVRGVVYSEELYLSVATAIAPTVPANKIRVAFGVLKTTFDVFSQTITQTFEALYDVRQASFFGNQFQAAGDFLVTNSGTTLTVAAGGLRQNAMRFTESSTSAVRRSTRIVFPSADQYDIRLRRITADTSSDQIFDKAYLTAIKSVAYKQPVNHVGVNGAAMRMLATDQLNGAVDQYNLIVSNVIPDYIELMGAWLPAVTSNPASIFRYVCQGGANERPMLDSQIDIAKLEEWHTHCAEKGYTYNRVIDYATSLWEVLKDVASAGAAAATLSDGKFSVVIDNIKPDIVQIVTPRNSWGYSGEFTYPELPHAFRVTFRNKNNGYQLDERIVYDDGYNESNAQSFEELEYLSATDSELAFKHGRRHIATARLRPEQHSWFMDPEHLVMTRGDRIKLAHDVPIVGVGDGRIKTIIDNGTHITSFTIDDVAEFVSAKNYYVRVRKAGGSQLYLALASGLSGNQSSFTLAAPLLLAGGFEVGDLCYFVEAGGELDLIVTRIEPQSEDVAKITAVNYAPEIFTAESATIPAFSSNISTPLSMIRPSSPVLVGEPISDESVMTRNSDGSITSRLSISLQNLNEGQVTPVVIVRQSGTDSFAVASLLESSTERVVLTGLQDGYNYDVWISYRRVGASLQSLPLQLNSYKFIGASGLPANVANFKSNIASGVINLAWDANPDIDISHYELRFSRVFTGASWDTAQVLEAVVNETRLTLPFIGGTYLIKAVDLSGNQSANASVIVTYADTVVNIVETLIENPLWAGTKTNCEKIGNTIIMKDTLIDAYYYFANNIDLTDVFSSIVTAKIIAEGSFTYDIYSVSDIYSLSDIYGGSAGFDLYSAPDIYSLEDIYGGAPSGSWDVVLEGRFTNDDPSGSPVWTAWQPVNVSDYAFRAAEFRLLLRSYKAGITPKVTAAEVVIDMPDRIERGEDVTVDATTGLTVVFAPAFKVTPAIPEPSIQNGIEGDRIEWVSKSASGFSIKVYNDILAAHVAREVDYVASGYGRVIV